ncbi:serine/threonine-protein kinase [Streptomyces sp. SID1121]|uniref:serine/threonine-protein kinase n=1 Tax=Streptomyces sp. SID1121 TaxID=3425888 RepID=UPI004055C792
MEHSQGTGAETGAGLMLAGRYRLGECIGSGGMGKVWRAHDEVLHRTVAVKELTAGRYVNEADRAVLHQRTQKEARAAARITHPGVVTVHDVLDHDGRPWIVMQYVDGPSLADAAKDAGRIDWREAARIGLQVLNALRAAHGAGVLHRDVKPGNVLLARDGRVLLTDFGIAAIEGDATITRTGELVGSIDYLAPERVRGADPGPASDLWSLGVTLYTAVQGVSPFRRTSPLSTMQAVVTEEPPRADRAGELEPVIAALLAKDPAVRPGAAETEMMLREVAAGRTSAGEQVYVPTRTAVQVPRPAPESGGPAPAAAPAEPTGPTAYSFGPPLPAGATPPNGSGTPPGPRTPHTPYNPPAPARRPGRHRTVVIAIVAAVVLGVGGGFAALKFGGGTDGSADPGTSASGGSGGTAPGRTLNGDKTDGNAQDTADPGKPRKDPTVPDGWHRVEDPEGFSLNVPDGWERRTDGDQIDYTPDDGDHFIRISVDTPQFRDPYAHLLDLEDQFKKRATYEKVRLERNTFRDQTLSAVWEFTWNEEQGHPGPRHAIDQMYYSDSGETEYALYMSGPEEDWDTTRRQFDAVLRSWEPPAEAAP